MNDRERQLAIIVGASVLVLIAFFGYSRYAGMVKTGRENVAKAQADLDKENRSIDLAAAANRKVKEYEARSLPPQPALARSLYQHWLLTKVQEVGLRDQVVSPSGQRPVEGIYVQQTFVVTGKGRYEQIIKLLDNVYRTDLLHRVSRLSLKPIKDSKELDLSLTLDAVSVLSAPEAKELSTKESKRLKLATVEEYQNSIVGRNIFAPPNHPPRLTGAGKQRGTTNRSVDIVVKASDPDPLDFVKLELLKSPDKSARLDNSGKLIWTPKVKGTFEFEIAARDDNFPPRVSTEKLIVTVDDPPPREEYKPTGPPPEPKLAFDNAKHTVLTAVLGVGDQAEVWLHVRPTAQLLKLHEGDSFEIGSIKGTIREILEDEFVYESTAKANKGKHLRLSRGETLEKSALAIVSTSTEVKTEETPEERTEEKTAVKPEIKPEVKTEDEPEVKVEVKTEAKPETTKPETTEPTADSSEPEPSPEKSEPTKVNGEEKQNHDDVILAAKLPAGYSSAKRDLEVLDTTANVLTVSKDGHFSKVIITRENRYIGDFARLTAAKGYLNATFAVTREAGWTIKTKEVPKLEDVDFSKPYALQWEFADADAKLYFIDTTVMFTSKGYLIRIFSDNAEELKVLRAWTKTIEPIAEK